MKHVLLALLLSLALVSPARAEPRATSYLRDGPSAPAPVAWVAYCATRAYDPDCFGPPAPTAPRLLEPTPRLFEVLDHVNRFVNDLPYRSDEELYGVPDYWTDQLGPTGGDCEDYALTKRRLLIERGLPRASLRVALVSYYVFGIGWVGHAVLTVDTRAGTYVLDNRHPDVDPWDRELTYRWWGRQTPSGRGWLRVPPHAYPG